MAVNLSPVGGVAAQFFTNNAVPLSGGKLYTYAAGTTTPQVAYTTSQGNIAWTNPIVLDAGGRVPGSGEIWLTDGLIYKFVLKDANDVLIATYDNITGINSNAVAYTNSQEIQTATAGQTVFTLTTMQYQVGTNSLSVFVDGVNQYGPGAQYAYTETSSTVVTFVSGLHVGAEVKFTTTQQQSAGAVDACQVSYTPPFTGSVTTSVCNKLEEYASVKDFGAVGDGIIDDTQAIQDAIDSGVTSIYFPEGNYVVTTPIQIPTGAGIRLYGAGQQQTRITGSGTFQAVFLVGDSSAQSVRGMIDHMFIFGSSTVDYGIYGTRVEHWTFQSLLVQGCKEAGISTGYGWCNNFIDCEMSYNAGHGLWLNKVYGGGGNNAIEILGCRIFANDKFGIKMENGYGIYIDGCTIEANEAGGIFNLGCQAVRIAAYFENNGTVGYTFTTPAKTVKADIILNGSSGGDLMTSAFPTRGVVIEACQAFNPIDAFIYNAGGVDTIVNGCTTPSAGKTLWLEQYEDQYKGAGVTISQCNSFDTLYAQQDASNNKISNFSSFVKIVDRRDATKTSRNYAVQDMNQWKVIALNTAAGTYSRSDNASYLEYQGVPAFQIETTVSGTSDVYGFELDAAKYPELNGQLVYFGLAGADTGGTYCIPFCSERLFYVTGLGNWNFATVAFVWPASGTVSCGFCITGNAGKAWAAGAVLAPVGYPVNESYADVPKNTKQWFGTAAPTLGTWERGDVVMNITPSSGGTPGWVCVSAGTPGTWKAMANLA